MKLTKIKYGELKPRQQEVFNFQKVASQLADYGFNCIKLADDWQGADFLAYHIDGEKTLKVQLKSRLAISKKYVGKSLFIAFPINGAWYLIEHDRLLTLIEKHTTWLASDSWRKHEGYSSASPNAELVAAISEWRL